jgi:predicted metal-dependent enzyme (double-stranded beta helix superfamily)
MSYTAAAFFDDCHAAMDQGPDLQASLALMSHNLARLLADPDFVAQTYQHDLPAGKRLLYHDTKHDFYIFAHVQAAGKSGSPHSHGDSWAIYGNAMGVTKMTEYERVNSLEEEGAVLRITDRYELKAGQTRAYPPGMIHSTAHPEKAWVIRMTGTDLNAIPRYHFKKATDRIVELQD